MPRVRTESVKTPLCRLSYPHLYDAQVRKGDDGQDKKPEFTVSLIFPAGTDLKPLKTMASNALREAFGAEKVAKMMKQERVKNPFLKGWLPKWADNPGMGPGVEFIRCTSQQPPGIVDRKKQPIPKSASATKVYPGVYAYAVVHCFTWENVKNGIGVTFGIDSVQISHDGERFGGGGVDPDKYFETLPDQDGEDEDDGLGDGLDDDAAPKGKGKAQTADDLFA